MNVYGGSAGGPREPKKPKAKRSRLRRTIYWSLGGATIMIVALVATVAVWLYSDLSSISNLDVGVKAATTDLAVGNTSLPIAKRPAVALVLGSDHRFTDGTAPPRSDTLMLVRLDPQHNIISLLSIPRDLYVNIPGIGMDKINAAFSEGKEGPTLALKTVEQVTGVHPNYLVVINFTGFRNLVNDIGGVYIPVDQNYQHSNVGLPTDETYSAISIDPGYQMLDGADALAYARYRHTDSDFYRNARQQVFLKQFEQAASKRFHGISVSDLPAIKNVIDDITHNTEVADSHGGVGWRTLLDYATFGYSHHPRLVSVRLNAQTGMAGAASIVTDSTADIERAVNQFEHPWKVAQPESALPKQPSKKPPFKPATKPSTVTVRVLNGTARPGIAAKIGTGLGKWGYRTTPANAPSHQYMRTWVYYQPGFQKAAHDLATILGHGYAGAIPARFHNKADVTVILGADDSGTVALKPPVKPKPYKPPTDMMATSQYKTYFATAARAAHLPGMYPTEVPIASTFEEFSPTEPIRAYQIKAAGGSKNSLYAYWNYDNTSGSYWGIEETRLVNAPILAEPSAVRKLGGRRFAFYFNGAHIHMVSVTDSRHGVVYWVQNSLLDELPNADMIAIARSLRPTS